MANVNVQTPPPAPADDVAAIRRKLAAIRSAARYLREYSRDVEESSSATAILARTAEIDILLDAAIGGAR